MGQDPISQVVNGLFGALGAGLAQALGKLALILFSTAAAAPAIATVLLLLLESRWHVLQRSRVASGIAGVVLTVALWFVLVWVLVVVDDAMLDGGRAFFALPYAAVAAVLFAVWFQFRSRASFTSARAAGIGGALAVTAVWSMFAMLG